MVQEAVFSRAEYLEGKADQLYTIEVYFVVLYYGSRHSLTSADKLHARSGIRPRAVDALDGPNRTADRGTDRTAGSRPF